jgi:hypothetical protein
MNNKKIEVLIIENGAYLEFGYDDEDELLLLEFDLITKEDEPNVL